MLERDRTGIVVSRVPGEYDSLVWTPFRNVERAPLVTMLPGWTRSFWRPAVPPFRLRVEA